MGKIVWFKNVYEKVEVPAEYTLEKAVLEGVHFSMTDSFFNENIDFVNVLDKAKAIHLVLGKLDKNSCDKPAISALKKLLPAFQLGNEYMTFDYDNLNTEQIENVLRRAKLLPYVIAGGVSCSGKGAYIIVKRSMSDEYARYYHHCKRTLEFIIPYEIDTLPDPNRIRFIGQKNKDNFYKKEQDTVVYTDMMSFIPKATFIVNDVDDNPVRVVQDNGVVYVRKTKKNKKRRSTGSENFGDN